QIGRRNSEEAELWTLRTAESTPFTGLLMTLSPLALKSPEATHPEGIPERTGFGAELPWLGSAQLLAKRHFVPRNHAHCMLALAAFMMATGCATPPAQTLRPGDHLLSQEPVAAKALPPPAASSTTQPPAGQEAPRPTAQDTYSLSVRNVSVQSLLQALAQDAPMDIDVHPAITGSVTLNVRNQTLTRILDRIARQAPIRYERDGDTLLILPDEPFIRHYSVDYVNLDRETTSTISVASQLGSPEGNATNARSAVPQQSGSGSTARIQNTSAHHFWQALGRNLTELLRETDGDGNLAACSASDPSADSEKPAQPAAAPCSALQPTRKASLTLNPEAGLLAVHARSHQHARVGAYLDSLLRRAQRQVFIEATIAEVALTQNFQQGIDWSALNLFGTGLRVVQQTVGAFSTTNARPFIELGYDSSGGNFQSVVKLLETFGSVRVLSSPKLAVLHNQTAVMKVVDDNVYFTYEIKETDATTNSPAKTTIQSTLHSVPVGLVLTITPMIGRDDSVTLNLRPSMSRVIGHKTDPSLQFLQGNASLTNTIPIIRAREFDSVLRIGNGNVAIMGGLMEDTLDRAAASISGLAALPLVGRLFQNRNDTRSKTELVIFVRPTVAPETGGDALARFALPDLRGDVTWQ
ncbi:MAG: secretin and TonB N-terminal domain-containing protein, partial [Candidatus Dactylopiibacterium sp.]|nr:secretin and TonB N-terminal domain-containing protein [Candidatus Dactylopiibacterium sp.]